MVVVVVEGSRPCALYPAPKQTDSAPCIRKYYCRGLKMKIKYKTHLNMILLVCMELESLFLVL